RESGEALEAADPQPRAGAGLRAQPRKHRFDFRLDFTRADVSEIDLDAGAGTRDLRAEHLVRALVLRREPGAQLVARLLRVASPDRGHVEARDVFVDGPLRPLRSQRGL